MTTQQLREHLAMAVGLTSERPDQWIKLRPLIPSDQDSYLIPVTQGLLEHFDALSKGEAELHGRRTRSAFREDLRGLTPTEIAHLLVVHHILRAGGFSSRETNPGKIYDEIVAVHHENELAESSGILGKIAVTLLRTLDRA